MMSIVESYVPQVAPESEQYDWWLDVVKNTDNKELFIETMKVVCDAFDAECVEINIDGDTYRYHVNINEVDDVQGVYCSMMELVINAEGGCPELYDANDNYIGALFFIMDNYASHDYRPAIILNDYSSKFEDVIDEHVNDKWAEY